MEMSINSGDVGVNSAGKSRMASRARQGKGNDEQRDQEVLREMDKQEPSEWELKLCWINEKTGNRITQEVIRDSS